jgi:hypothetical protein
MVMGAVSKRKHEERLRELTRRDSDLARELYQRELGLSLSFHFFFLLLTCFPEALERSQQKERYPEPPSSFRRPI